LLAVLGLTSSLWAADPIIGTWKLNVEKSTFNQYRQEPSEEIIEVYREIENNQIELTLPAGSVLTWPVQGGIVNIKVMKGDSSRSYVQTRIGPDEWLVTVMEDGKQIRTRHKKISKDGKTMRQTYRGLNEGYSFEMLDVYEKQ
jgi:hypothetical protein